VGRQRIAIVSDTHGWLDPRIAAEVEDCDQAVHAGDIGSAAVLEALKPRTGKIVAVLGNNDVPTKWRPEETPVLGRLPLEARLDLAGGPLVVIHGHQHTGPLVARHNWLRKRYPGARLIVYGHSHRRIFDDAESPWILNPGAAGRARTYGGPSYAVLSTSNGDWRVDQRRFELATGSTRNDER
jgi:putative phosphoesterase